MPIRTCAAATLLLQLIACSGGDQSSATTTVVDSAGVAIATSSAEDHALPWSFHEEFLLGGEPGGPESFTSVSSNTVQTDGRDRIIVLNRDDDRIEVFDAAGTHLRSIGGPGSGPGEFTFALELLDAGGGRVGLTDVSKQAMLLWSLDGSLLEERRIADPSTGLGRRMLRGDTTVTMAEQRDTLRSRNRLVQVVGADTALLARHEAAPGRMVELSCVVVQMPPMFTPRYIWTSGGALVAGATNSEYVVNIFRGGRLVLSVRRGIAPTASRPGDALRQYPEGWTVRFGGGGEGCTMEGDEVAEKAGMAPFLPVISELSLGPDESLWVRRHGFPGDSAVVDVFDRAGAYLGTMTGRGIPLGFLGGDRVLLPVEDRETGVIRIGVYRMTREGAEGVQPT
jgi:hypothetical protein